VDQDPERHHEPGHSELTQDAGQSDSRRDPPDRYWFLTWTSYGTWLPGDDRGFVSNIDCGDGQGHRLNTPGTQPASKMRGLEIHARMKLSGPPVYLNLDQATRLLDQFHETANHRGWELIAVAIMRNHVHIVAGVPGDPEPETILAAFKSYGSRCLNREFGKRESETWWTAGGSKRPLKTESSILAAVTYVRNQADPLIVWISEKWLRELSGDAAIPAVFSASGGRGPTVSDSTETTKKQETRIPHSPSGQSVARPVQTTDEAT
jgi:REP element-mobilizing transposase RayT